MKTSLLMFTFSLLCALHCSKCYVVMERGLLTQPAKPAPEYKLNLDDAPFNRWQHIARDFDGSEISEWLDGIINELLPMPELLKPIIEALAGDIESYFPQEIADEMKGLSKALNLKLEEVILINVVYDLTAFNSSNFKVCTSIVAQDADGHIYHGRNLDYNDANFMRNFTIQVDFQKNGSTLFKASTFIGYVGVITGLKPGKFSITGDERDSGHFVDNLLSALHHSKLTFMLQREVLQTATSYDEAMHLLTTTHTIAPVYYIVAGNKVGQGAIIVRDPTETVRVVNMTSEQNHP